MFVLINIPATDKRKNIFPLGLAYIAACYEKYGDVKIFDLHYDNNVCEVFDYFFLNEVKFVGFSVCSSHESISRSSYFAKMIKRISPKTIIGIGGHHATYQGKEIIEHHTEFDVAFIGEGELAAIQFARNISSNKTPYYENVNNIIYREDNKVVVSEYKKNDVYLLPARHLFPTCREYSGKFNEELPVICIESTRGCVGKCSFCALKLDPTKSYVKKKLNLFYEDLKQTIVSQKLEIVDLFIVDADFLISKDRAMEILNILKEFPEVRYFNIASCTDSVLRSKDLLDDLFEAGCTYIEIGVESFSHKQLERYDKRSSIETSIEAIELLNLKQKKYRFSYKIDIIMFEPFASLEDIKISNKFLQKYTYASSLNENNFFHIMDLFPGTKYRIITEDGKLSLPSSEMDVPFWIFKDYEVAQLYKYVTLYNNKIFSDKDEIEHKIEDKIYKYNDKKMLNVKDLRILKTMTYDWFNEMLNANSHSQYYEIFEKYYTIYLQIKSRH